MAISPLFFLPSSLFSFLPFVFFKVSRQSEAACHRSFVYSDKIAAFIVCQINLKKRSEEGIVRERVREREREREREKKGRGKRRKKNKQQHPYHAVLKPGPSLFLSVHDKFKRSLSPLLFPPRFLFTLSTVSALHHLPF